MIKSTKLRKKNLKINKSVYKTKKIKKSKSKPKPKSKPKSKHKSKHKSKSKSKSTRKKKNINQSGGVDDLLNAIETGRSEYNISNYLADARNDVIAEQVTKIYDQEHNTTFLTKFILRMKDNNYSNLLLIRLLNSVEGEENRKNIINHQNNDNQTALMIAINNLKEHREYKTIIITLLKNGADVNIQDSFGNTPLIFAIKQDSLEIVTLLLEKLRYVNRITPLMYAIKMNKSYEIIELLIDNYANVSAVFTPQGSTTKFTALTHAINKYIRGKTDNDKTNALKILNKLSEAGVIITKDDIKIDNESEKSKILTEINTFIQQQQQQKAPILSITSDEGVKYGFAGGGKKENKKV